MIRTLHFSDPEDAAERLAFLGVPSESIARLQCDLRTYLVGIPEGRRARALQSVLDRHGVVSARGRRHLLFTVSSHEQVGRWMTDDPAAAEALLPVREAVTRSMTRRFRVPCRGRVLDLSGPPRIMGILNVTPDSFSDGGKHVSTEAAVRRGLDMVREGADIIDVGGESTRPGSKRVPAEEELSRVIPVIRELKASTDALLSVDTTKAVVARSAADAGAHVINDTSALADDPSMAAVARSSGCAIVLMHRRGTPETMQAAPSYESLFDELLGALCARIEAAEGEGIPRERILVDPGIGFGKRLEDNLALHRHLRDMRNLGRPILFGPSRKAFLGTVTGIGVPEERVIGTAASVTAAVLSGAHVVRVHDVKEMVEAVKVAAAIAQGVEC